MVLLARQLYFEAVKVGDELPPLVKPPVDRAQIARYCGATGEYGPLHVDEPFARASGFPSVLVPGMLAMGFLGELAVDWLRGARLVRFGARFVKIVWPGDVLTSRGRVVDRRFEGPGRYVVDIELWAENQRGELVVRGGVTAQLYYSAEDEARQRAGQPALVVTPAQEEEQLARLSRGSSPARPAAPPRAAPPKAPPAKPAPAPRAAPPPAPRPPARTATHAPARAAPPAAPRPAAHAPSRPASRAAARAKARPKAGHAASSRPRPKPAHAARRTVRPAPRKTRPPTRARRPSRPAPGKGGKRR